MRLEALSRLIAAADFLSFREIALKALALRGYKEPSLTDGWKDGGTDIVVSQVPPNPTRVAIQISVERDWQAKLKSDARKVKDKLGLQDLIFITSRRIPEAEFFGVADEIRREYDVRVSRLDNQTIASIFFEHGQTTAILGILGIDVAQPHRIFTSFDSARLDAGYSFVFFGADTQHFRERIMESAIITAASKSTDPVPRSTLLSDAGDLLQMPQARKQLSGAIDRMIQKGELVSESRGVVLNPRLKDAALTVQIVRDREWRSLRDEIQDILTAAWDRKKISDETIDSMMEDIGGLLMSTADATFYSLDRSDQRGVAQEKVQQRLRHLHATLDAINFPAGELRAQTMEKIASRAGSSPVGKQVLAGDLYLSLSSISTPQLVRALGASSNLQICLDSSVAIPILSGLLYKAASTHRYFIAASHAYEQLSALNVKLLIPRDYLEEVASHLFMAYRDYSSIVDLDPDLTESENAFVAHYVAFKQKNSGISFDQYLAGFGFDNALKRADLPLARDVLMPKLARLFNRYNIGTAELKYRQGSSKKSAEQMIARALDALSQNRPQIVQQHDARTLAALREQYENANQAVVFCTWDKLHFWILEHENPSWDVMDPAVLGDILSLINPNQEDAPITSPTFLAKALSEESVKAGAAVWDKLVKIEKGNLQDAELLTQAQEFKRTYLAEKKQGLRSDDTAQAWMKWKEGDRTGKAGSPSRTSSV